MHIIRRRLSRMLLLAAGMSFVTGAGFAADDIPTGPIGSPAAMRDALSLMDKSPGTIVADVNGDPVNFADVAQAIRMLPRINAEATFQQIVREATNLVIGRKVLAGLAVVAGLESNPAVQRRIRTAQDQLLGDELLQHSLAPNLLEPAVKSTYDATPVSKSQVPEVQLRVIAVGGKADADDVIRKIQDGADFAGLAKSVSLDPSAPDGGLLPYNRRDTIAPALAAVGFSMDPGDLTAYPVHSNGLWFVIRCEARRTRQPLTFAEARPEVERDIVKIGSSELRRLALKQTNINYYGLIGKSAPAPVSR